VGKDWILKKLQVSTDLTTYLQIQFIPWILSVAYHGGGTEMEFGSGS